MSSAPEGGNRNGRMLPMCKLKELALIEISREHPLRGVLLGGKDLLAVGEYLAKRGVWLPVLWAVVQVPEIWR